MRRMVFAVLALAVGACGSSSLPAGARDDGGSSEPDAKVVPPLSPDAGVDAARDGAAPDAAADTRSAPDAADDVEPPEPDGGITDPTRCLPDGSGRFVLQTSGGLDIDTAQGNDFFCSGSSGSDGRAFLNWAVPVRGTSLRAAFNLTIPGFARGLTGSGKPVELVVLIAGDQGNIWNAPELCKVDLTGNAPAAGAPGNVYKITGTIRCPPIAGQRQPTPPLAIARFEFTSAVTFE